MKKRAYILLAFCLTVTTLSAAILPASGNRNLGNIWFIGDSITQGSADLDPLGSPRKYLYDYLLSNGYTFGFTGTYQANPEGLPASHRYHSGYLGHRNDQLNTIVQQQSPVVPPDIILIQSGTNDILQNLSVTAPAHLLNLIVSANARAFSMSGKVPTIFVAKIPEVYGAPFFSNPFWNQQVYPLLPWHLAAYNSSVADVVSLLKAYGYDIHLVDQNTPLTVNPYAWINTDGVHPNQAGNTVVASTWFFAIHNLVN